MIKTELVSKTLSPIETFQKENARAEMCSIVILRKRLRQTCMMSIQDENFVFTKVPCVVFSGEDR